MEKRPSPNRNIIMDFCHGMNYHAYRFFGSHPEKNEEGKGFRFRVWAPAAKEFRLWATSINGILMRIH